MRRVTAVAVVVATALVSCTSGADNDGAGEAIEVFGPWLRDDADAIADVLDGFEPAEVRYTGSSDFVADLGERLASGVERPDIALVPQPAFVDEMIENGDLVAFSDDVVAAMTEGFVPGSWAEVDGSVYALPYRANVKSLVWFRPDVFAANGWQVPETLDELDALVEEIESTTDIAPWCFSIAAGGETGWPATDWIEDLLLRQAGPEVYDQWVAGDISFTDPRVEQAFQTFEQLVLAPGRAFGGRSEILQVEVARAADSLFATPPGCAMFKQASFATSWFPDGTTIGPDGTVDFFTFPGAEAAEAPPLLVAGTLAVQLSDDPEVDELMAYLASPDGAEAWARRGGYISSRTNVDLDRYYTGTDVRFSALLQDAPATRFDASDRFDSALRQAVLTGITSWIAGRVTLDELLVSLDEQAAQTG